MAHLTIHYLDDDVIARLKARATVSKHSLETELRIILHEAANISKAQESSRRAERIPQPATRIPEPSGSR